MKKFMFLFVVCCLCLCGCENKSYNCQKIYQNESYENKVQIKFTCNGSKIIDNEVGMTYAFANSQMASDFYNELALTYEDISINGRIIKAIQSSGSGSPHEEIDNCGKLIKFYESEGMKCDN